MEKRTTRRARGGGRCAVRVLFLTKETNEGRGISRVAGKAKQEDSRGRLNGKG